MFELLDLSPLVTVQDGGRRGWQAYGVPASGPMDAFAHRAANLLVANPPDAAALEIGLSPASFITRTACVIAATGCGFSLYIDNRPARLWISVYVPANRLIRFDPDGSGNWAYLAIHGGISNHPALGSRSTYIRAPLTMPLHTGELLPVGLPAYMLINLTGRSIPRTALPYRENPVLRVIPGPQLDFFSSNSLENFYHSEYTIFPTSDRMGYRLTGQPLDRATEGELLSEGMARGCIQVPADGLPIIMQADCPTTGGYPKIGAVISADQPVLAQVRIGSGKIRFAVTTIEVAQAAYREMIASLSRNLICPIAEDSLW